MPTIGYCVHCRKVKNVTISPKNLMCGALVGICDDCAAELEPPVGPALRDRTVSVQPPTMPRDNATPPDDATTSRHRGACHSLEDPPLQPHPHPARPADRTPLVNDSPDHSSRFETHPALDLSVEAMCDTCERTETFQVNRACFTAWSERRMPIQRAFAHLSIPDREFLKSRICPSCWTDMFGPGPFGA